MYGVPNISGLTFLLWYDVKFCSHVLRLIYQGQYEAVVESRLEHVSSIKRAGEALRPRVYSLIINR